MNVTVPAGILILSIFLRSVQALAIHRSPLANGAAESTRNAYPELFCDTKPQYKIRLYYINTLAKLNMTAPGGDAPHLHACVRSRKWTDQ